MCWVVNAVCVVLVLIVNDCASRAASEYNQGSQSVLVLSSKIILCRHTCGKSAYRVTLSTRARATQVLGRATYAQHSGEPAGERLEAGEAEASGDGE